MSREPVDLQCDNIPVRGTCALCRAFTDLRDSHLLPKSLYRFVRRTSVGGGGSPIIVTPEAVWSTDTQVTRHLLCGACEQRFHQNGEDWTLRQVYRGDGSFKLLETLKRLRPMGETAQAKVYDVADVPEIDTAKLAYFGVSVFWRAAAKAWAVGEVTLQTLDFGPVYAEALRTYLLGQTEFPQNIVITATVCDAPNLAAATLALPTGGRVEGYHKYFFAVPGIAFHLLIGKAIPDLMRHVCLASGAHRVILLNNYEQMLADSFFAKMRTAKVSRKLR